MFKQFHEWGVGKGEGSTLAGRIRDVFVKTVPMSKATGSPHSVFSGENNTQLRKQQK